MTSRIEYQKLQSGSLFYLLSLFLLIMGMVSCGDRPEVKKGIVKQELPSDSLELQSERDSDQTVSGVLISPGSPGPGQPFRVLITGSKSIHKAKIMVTTPDGVQETSSGRKGNGLPFWRIDEFKATSEGKYMVAMKKDGATIDLLDFTVGQNPDRRSSHGVWSTEKGWDAASEELYSAWINALFCDADERSSWKALHEVTQDPERNFLHNFLSMNEDNAAEKNKVVMQPDCADNPFYFRAYFAWKLGLPFGFHECDRGYLGKAPHTGRWITNETQVSGNPVRKFNVFLRMVANGVHSGTARTALADESSDYYPVPLTMEALRPGIVYADPYGHTLVLVHTVPQTSKTPGVLLSVDAQPDGTVGIKRFWKGNFLFNTKDVVGEPGFKAFRPITVKEGKSRLVRSEEINANPALIPGSFDQKGMESQVFYHTMERIINPKPLDPESALLDLVKALHEQLTVRITSVENGEAYMKAHPGTVIPMPGSANGLFQTGGLWEDFSTPNRDLRLLIAMDAVQEFPDKVLRAPGDYKLPMLTSVEHVRRNLDQLLKKKLSELSITYTRTDGSGQKLTLEEILQRKEAFEMAYNPNDGVEIRWGAPEKSAERATCKRQVPSGQAEKMKSFRQWFSKRLHPPT